MYFDLCSSGIIQLVHKIFRKTNTYVCVSGGEKFQFFWKILPTDKMNDPNENILGQATNMS